MGKKFNDGIKVLVYGDVSKLESTMNHHFLDQLIEVSDDITQTPLNIGELNRYIAKGEFSHLLIPDEWFHRMDGTLKGCDVPVVELLGDHWVPWAFDKKKEYIKENDIKHAIVFSERFQKEYKDLLDMHCVLTGYNSSVFVDKGLGRDIDILIHGSLGKKSHELEVYPVRKWLSKVLPKIGGEVGLRVESWEHPGYWHEGDRSSEDFIRPYSNVLNRSKIAIGGSSHWRLPLKKFYEVSACGGILLSDLPLEDKVFFEGKILEVDPEKIGVCGYENEVRDMIVKTLSNYDEVRSNLQPFGNKQDVFDKSYTGKALEIRKVLSGI